MQFRRVEMPNRIAAPAAVQARAFPRGCTDVRAEYSISMPDVPLDAGNTTISSSNTTVGHITQSDISSLSIPVIMGSSSAPPSLAGINRDSLDSDGRMEELLRSSFSSDDQVSESYEDQAHLVINEESRWDEFDYSHDDEEIEVGRCIVDPDAISEPEGSWVDEYQDSEHDSSQTRPSTDYLDTPNTHSQSLDESSTSTPDDERKSFMHMR
jgi:hypothetical protein